MSAPRFHCDFPLAPHVAGAEIELAAAASRHIAQSLRMRIGDAVTLFDGGGGEYSAFISRIDRRGVAVRIAAFDPRDRESSHPVTLAQSVIASDMMDLVVRKAVELGVRDIVPLHAERSQRIPEARGARRALHWRQIAIAACEQCGRNLVPSIADVVTLDEWMSDRHPENDAIVLDADATTPLAVSARARMPSLVLVGPEGGLTDAERKHAAHRGFIPVRLGASVLRAETAALAALAALLVLQDVR